MKFSCRTEVVCICQVDAISHSIDSYLSSQTSRFYFRKKKKKTLHEQTTLSLRKKPVKCSIWSTDF